MTARRMAELLLSHAMADGVPAGPLLRRLPSHSALQAAQLAEAGQLEEALTMVGFAADQAWIAKRWPAAARPVLARLSQLPDGLVFEAPVLQTLGYFALVSTLQLAAAAALHRLVVPSLVAMSPAVGATGGHTLLLVVVLDLLLMGAALGIGVWVVAGRHLGFSPHGWRGPLGLAREAALAEALRDAGAPEELFGAYVRGCSRLQGRGVSPLELELIRTHALADAVFSLQRFLGGLRLAGYGALTMLALLALSTIMVQLAQLGGRF